MGTIKRWFLGWFSPAPSINELMVTVSVTLDQAVILRKAAESVWTRKLQSLHQSADGMSRSHFEYEAAQLERILDAIDLAVKRHRDQS